MRLTVETGPLAGTVVTLEREHPIMLGSGADCAVRIREAGVAEHHAVVKALRGEGFGIKLLGSGLRVNGSDVQASPLNDGDVIELGTTRIAFGQTQDHGLPQISGYRIIDLLGAGGMGTVYRAEQVSLHREVALKVLNETQTRDAEFVAQFVAEARAAAKLQHPNVVSVFDVEHDGDTYYYAMELMHDGSCEDYLKQNGSMPVDRALQIIADAAAGLAYAESLGIVHRDIKPDNLMLDQHGTVKIADLGLASTGGGAGGERAIGTPHFMAPEQVLNRDLDHRTDLYALGCTFYRLVTGKTPFRGQTVKDILRAQVKEDAEPASKANPDVPAEVTAIIQRLMAKEPADRYQTANELLEELEVMVQPEQKRGLWIGLAAAGVIAAGGAIYWAVNKPTETVVKEVKYDDPEKQQFADRIVVLESEARLREATIALLTARLSGKVDEQLALALDQVASAHAGTPTAVEASERAAAVRRDVAARAQQLEQRRTRIAEHLATVRRATLQPLDGFDYVRALRALDAAPAKELADDAELLAGIEKLRDEILAKARERLTELRQPVKDASSGSDEQALSGAIDALLAGIAPDTRWPKSLANDVTAAKNDAATARTALAEMQQQRVAGVWQDYYSLLQTPDGWRSQIARRDFAAAANSIATFAGAANVGEASSRAKGLAALTRHADSFAQALAAASDAGSVRIVIGDNPMLVVRWERSQQQLVLRDPERRNSKEQPYSTDKLHIEQWITLADQVDGAAAGSRECFLGLVALTAHSQAGNAFLRKLDKSNDETGTGEQGYPFSADVFDGLLSQLPPGNDAAWDAVLRDELEAGMRLASGLRALSERRNLAAAGHLDKLFAEHPRSFLVAVLP